MNKPSSTPSSSKDKWNRIYQKNADTSEQPQPCDVLAEFHYLLPPSGKALDLASGRGGNALFLENRGFQTSAWDISDVAIEQLNSLGRPNLTTRIIDIEHEPFPDEQFDVIVVSDYLYRDLCPRIIANLNPGGILFYQTFHQDKINNIGPSNPNFLIKNNELIELFNGLDVLHYHRFGSQGDTKIGNRDRVELIVQQPL